MVVLDIPFIYHPSTRAYVHVARGQGRYMNGVSRTTMVYLFNILTVVSLVTILSGGEERESLANFMVTFRSGCPLFFRTVDKV